MAPQFEEWLLILKISFIVLSLGMVGFMVFAIIKSSWLKYLILYDAAEFLSFRPYGVKKLEKQWGKITARLDTGLESEYKLAIIEADSMMDDTLKRMGYSGESLGERLEKLTSATLPNIEDIKQAHQTRNNIIHDPDYSLSLDDARSLLGVYERAFRDLQAF
jgi:hypothetical protein